MGNNEFVDKLYDEIINNAGVPKEMLDTSSFDITKLEQQLGSTVRLLNIRMKRIFRKTGVIMHRFSAMMYRGEQDKAFKFLHNYNHYDRTISNDYKRRKCHRRK